jgi:hypothetical protein
MLKDIEGWKDITIDFELSAHQRAVLAGTIGQEWFDIVQKIFEDVVRKMQLQMANTPPWDKEAVLARHTIAQAAALMYKGVFERIYEQVGLQQVIESGVGSIHNPEKPPLMEEFQETPQQTELPDEFTY